VVIEAAWHYRHVPTVGKMLRTRRRGQPAAVIALADKALQRLHRRFARLMARGKTPHKAVVAVGRELVGFVWAAPTATEAPHDASRWTHAASVGDHVQVSRVGGCAQARSRGPAFELCDRACRSPGLAL
jgi:hypothetical protein